MAWFCGGSMETSFYRTGNLCCSASMAGAKRKVLFIYKFSARCENGFFDGSKWFPKAGFLATNFLRAFSVI
jgi:hypothetical protein